MRKRRELWARFEDLIRRSQEGGIDKLRHDELRELALLYRQVAADLATVREDPSSASLSAYLNQLLGRAHNLLYSGTARRGGSLWRFFASDFPRLARDTMPLILASAAIFAGFGVVAYLAAQNDPGLVRAYLPAEMRDTIDHHRMWTHSIVGVQPAASSGIMTNNMTVAFMTFASGISGGLLTFYLLAHNGVMMGVVASACAAAGMGMSLWSFVAGHGSLELPAIFVAGGAGFTIARGMLFPGSLPRRMSLERAGGTAARLVLGTVPMLVVAGLVEGFISPSDVPVPLKLALGAGLFALLVSWIAQGGRERPARGHDDPPATAGSAPSLPGSH
jgi:uncharacterized membrane protein SpoIIM required for sporulation